MKLLTLFLFLLSSFAFAETTKELIKKRQDHLQKFYEDLHANPELSKQEKRTAEKLAEEWRSLGLEVTEGIGGYGIVGVLENGEGPVTWIRTEMDALPLTEKTGLPFASRVAGVMHGCGHDFHMAALSGVAYVLVNSKERWKGTIVFVGQPAEETISGAKAMIEDGVLDRFPKPEHLLALHSSGRYKAGTINMAPGYALANVDSFDVTLKGKGAHGSSPHMSIDPITMAAEFVFGMQLLVNREKDPAKLGMITVGSLHSGTSSSIIPDEAKLQLTTRSYEDSVRDLFRKRIPEIAEGIAHTHNAPLPIVELRSSVNAVFNDITFAQFLLKFFGDLFGASASVQSTPIMGGEDFGEFSVVAKVPSAFFWIGINPGIAGHPSNHSPQYDPQFDKNGPFAIEAFAAAVLELNKR